MDTPKRKYRFGSIRKVRPINENKLSPLEKRIKLALKKGSKI